MDNHTSLLLASLLADTKLFLKQCRDPILADADDCNYFRKKFKKAPLQANPSVDSLPSPTAVPQFFAELPKPAAKTAIPVEPKSAIQPAFRLEANVPSTAETNALSKSETIVEINPTSKPIPKAAFKQEILNAEEEKKSVPVSSLKPTSFSTRWDQLFASIAPELSILKEIPHDAIAKKINTRWKTKNQIAPITLLYFQEIPEQKLLLEQIAKALDVYFGPAKLISAEAIEREKQWEAMVTSAELQLVICCDYTLWQLSGLMRFYKETPVVRKESLTNVKLHSGEQEGIIGVAREANDGNHRLSAINRQLGNKPLFLLPDLSLYLKDPLLKRSLWKALCQTLSPLLSSTKT